MKKKIRVVLLAVVLVTLAGCYSIVDKNNAMYDTKIDNEAYVANVLIEGGSVTQEFTSVEKKIDGVSVELTATGNQNAIQVSYQLIDIESGKLVVEGKTSLEKLKSGKFFKIPFDSIENTEGRVYEFALKVDSCGEGGSVTTYAIPDDGNLVLRTITHRFDIETFVISICFVLYIVLFVRWLSKLFK